MAKTLCMASAATVVVPVAAVRRSEVSVGAGAVSIAVVIILKGRCHCGQCCCRAFCVPPRKWIGVLSYWRTAIQGLDRLPTTKISYLGEYSPGYWYVTYNKKDVERLVRHSTVCLSSSPCLGVGRRENLLVENIHYDYFQRTMN